MTKIVWDKVTISTFLMVLIPIVGAILSTSHTAKTLPDTNLFVIFIPMLFIALMESVLLIMLSVLPKTDTKKKTKIGLGITYTVALLFVISIQVLLSTL